MNKDVCPRCGRLKNFEGYCPGLPQAEGPMLAGYCPGLSLFENEVLAEADQLAARLMDGARLFPDDKAFWVRLSRQVGRVCYDIENTPYDWEALQEVASGN